MKLFFHYFFGIMDKTDKKRFFRYVIVLFFGSIFAILGIGAVIPFINLLIQPEKIMAFSWFSKFSYNQVIVILTTLMIIAFAIKNTVALWLLNFQSKFLFNLVAKIQSKLFSGYMAQPYEYHLNRSTPELIKNVNNETTMLSTYIVGPFGICLTEAFSSSFVVIALFIINPIFTTLVVVFLGLGVGLFIKMIRKKINYYAKTRSDSWTSMTDNVLAGLSGIKEAKLYHCEYSFVNAFKKNTLALRDSGAYQLTFQQAPRMLIEFIGLTVVMCVLCAFILLGSSPEHMFVILGVFGIAAAQLLPSLNRLTQALVQIKYGFPALISIYKEIHLSTDRSRGLFEKKPSVKKLLFRENIELNKLYYAYQDGTLALNGASLSLPKNKKIAIVGASGAGKTTLVDLLMGLYKPKSGNISVDGQVVDDSNYPSFQKLFAYIPQLIVLYDRTIEENIAFGVNQSDIDNKKIWASLKAAQLDQFVMDMKLKEKTMIGEGGVRLSGGQRQRIGIARALYQNPEILVMDEATSALDNQTESEVTEVLSSLENLTIITIAHRLTTIKDYDIIYMIQNGKVIAKGNFQSLEETSYAFQKLLMSNQVKKIENYAC